MSVASILGQGLSGMFDLERELRNGELFFFLVLKRMISLKLRKKSTNEIKGKTEGPTKMVGSQEKGRKAVPTIGTEIQREN